MDFEFSTLDSYVHTIFDNKIIATWFKFLYAKPSRNNSGPAGSLLLDKKVNGQAVVNKTRKSHS